MQQRTDTDGEHTCTHHVCCRDVCMHRRLKLLCCLCIMIGMIEENNRVFMRNWNRTHLINTPPFLLLCLCCVCTCYMCVAVFSPWVDTNWKSKPRGGLHAEAFPWADLLLRNHCLLSQSERVWTAVQLSFKQLASQNKQLWSQPWQTMARWMNKSRLQTQRCKVQRLSFGKTVLTHCLFNFRISLLTCYLCRRKSLRVWSPISNSAAKNLWTFIFCISANFWSDLHPSANTK